MLRAARRRSLAALLVMGLLLASCTGDDPDGPPVARAPSPAAGGQTSTAQASTPDAPSIGDTPTPERPSAEPTDDPPGTPTAEPSPTPGRTLPEEWYVDSNGNFVPDFVEAELGLDPEAIDCLEELDCPGVTGADIGSLASVQQSTLLILDSSGSMAEDVADGRKIDLAKEAITFYATGTPDTTDLGFMVYGHQGSADPAQKQESCEGVELLAPLGEADHESVPGVLGEFDPAGFTPIGRALEHAQEAFAGREEGDNRVILVSDGLETCDGDPVEAARRLQSSGIAVTVDVIGFDVPDDEVGQLQQIADAGGGEFLPADTGGSLIQAMIARLGVTVEAAEARVCVATGGALMGACLTNESIQSTRHMNELRQQGPPEGGSWSREQDAEISQLVIAASEWAQEQNVQIRETAGPVLEEIERALEEANERLERQYGEELSFGAFCWQLAAGPPRSGGVRDAA
ncbi:MAG: VWA domain-containing protein [Euzebyales bacterium]|nr:VWA domain-containing protein [Euzebyales bacterium]